MVPVAAWRMRTAVFPAGTSLLSSMVWNCSWAPLPIAATVYSMLPISIRAVEATAGEFADWPDMRMATV